MAAGGTTRTPRDAGGAQFSGPGQRRPEPRESDAGAAQVQDDGANLSDADPILAELGIW